MKIYYAHHQWKYGTLIEEYEFQLIQAAFPHGDIINPNGQLNETNPAPDVMLEYLNLVRGSDVFVFSTLSGVIGIGVSNELLFAKEMGIPIYEICDGKVVKLSRFSIRLLSGDVLTEQKQRTFAVVKTEVSV